MDGLIDNVVVFNDVLSEAEIDGIRDGSYDYKSDDDCVAVWNFESTSFLESTKAEPSLTSNQILQYNSTDLDPQEWIGGFVRITSGDGDGQIRQIAYIEHDSTTIVKVTRNWDTVDPPDSGSNFQLVARSAYKAMFATGQEECGVATGGDYYKLYDNTKYWTDEYDVKSVSGNLGVNYNYYSYIMIVEGKCAGDIRYITSCNDNTINVGVPWSGGQIPDETSIYVIVPGTKVWTSPGPTTWYRWPDQQAQDSSIYRYDFPAFTVVRYFLENYAMDQTDRQDDLDDISDIISDAVSGFSFSVVPAIYRPGSSEIEAWMPCPVNLLNVGTLVGNEPFVSTDGAFNAQFRNSAGAYIDGWYFGHTGQGEIHCLTNVKRDPGNLATWWQTGP